MVGKIRILVVDDEAEVRDMFARFLGRKGFDVFDAPNALEAIRIHRREHPDLVLTDYHMPEMSGIELLKELHQADAHLPVILMSGAADMRSAVDALKAQAFDFLMKPIDSNELLRTIQLALERKAAAEGPPADAGKIVGPIYATKAPDHPDIVVLTLNRALDEFDRPAYESALARLDADGELLSKIVLVLKNVTYINNIGLDFLLATFAKWRSERRTAIVAQMSDPIHRYLKTLGYLESIPSTSTIGQAVEALQ